MSLITGNKVRKTHKPRYCEKEKDKANKRILRSISFDNNGLVKPSCRTVALYGPFVCFFKYGRLGQKKIYVCLLSHVKKI